MIASQELVWEHQSQTLATQLKVNNTFNFVMNLVTPKAAANCDLLFSKLGLDQD